MAVRKKRSISMPPDLDAQIDAVTKAAGMSYSAWLAAAARKELLVQAGLDAVAEYERTHGAFTEDELSAADAWVTRAIERSHHTGPVRRSA